MRLKKLLFCVLAIIILNIDLSAQEKATGAISESGKEITILLKTIVAHFQTKKTGAENLIAEQMNKENSYLLVKIKSSELCQCPLCNECKTSQECDTSLSFIYLKLLLQSLGYETEFIKSDPGLIPGDLINPFEISPHDEFENPGRSKLIAELISDNPPVSEATGHGIFISPGISTMRNNEEVKE